MWSPTADYLSQALPAYRFRIVPLDFAAVEPAVADGRIDFVLVNPAIYVNLEVRHRVSRIATMRNRVAGFERNVFGGVIFTRADRSDIKTLRDLPSHSFAAVDPTSLGGFQMAWGTLAKQGIDPYADFRPLRFTEIHDAVVMEVLRGEVGAGSVRTDILERMAADGIIQMSDIRVLNPQSDPEFPFVRSAPLYPEWPFGKLRKTPNALAQQVAIALLQMPADDRAARGGLCGLDRAARLPAGP
jgi:ABC-type phosphate/phosphonate transport system substrate-binding protein